jgi:hypothetical protein
MRLLLTSRLTASHLVPGLVPPARVIVLPGLAVRESEALAVPRALPTRQSGDLRP